MPFFNQKNCMNALKLFFCWKTRKENYSRKKNFIKHKDYMQFFIMLSLFEKKKLHKKERLLQELCMILQFLCALLFLRDREKRAFGCNYVQIMIYGVWLTGNGSSIAFQPQLLRLKKKTFFVWLCKIVEGKLM